MVYVLKQTKQFSKWLSKLDAATRARINFRLHRAQKFGHFGDHHGVGGGVSEMRMDFGPGYRVYYSVWEYRGRILLLLLGGDKSGQQKDIDQARELLSMARAGVEQEMEDERHGR